VKFETLNFAYSILEKHKRRNFFETLDLPVTRQSKSEIRNFKFRLWKTNAEKILKRWTFQSRESQKVKFEPLNFAYSILEKHKRRNFFKTLDLPVTRQSKSEIRNFKFRLWKTNAEKILKRWSQDSQKVKFEPLNFAYSILEKHKRRNFFKTLDLPVTRQGLTALRSTYSDAVIKISAIIPSENFDPNFPSWNSS
jgi:hypothetical protein